MNETPGRALLERILSVPTVIYVLLSFSIAYVLFFVRPVFFNSALMMQFFQSVPAVGPIGVDLKQMLSYSGSWAVLKQTPYIGANLYPPLASILFAPLLRLEYFTAYQIVTAITLISFGVSVLLIPWWVGEEKKISSLLMLLFATAIFSYGFQFELERGQFNIIAFFLCLSAIYLYHYHPKYRYVGYLLFSLSIQLKVFPAIFVVMLVKDWRDWKSNLRRLVALAACNFFALFVLGFSVFADFLNALKDQTTNPYNWIGNHSVKSFVRLYAVQLFEKIQATPLAWLNDYKWLPGGILLGVVGICLALIVLRAYQQNAGTLNPQLLLACVLGALLIPSVSHDYKLSILPGPIAIVLASGIANPADSMGKRIAVVLLTIVIAFAYSVTLFSYTNKPAFLENNLPVLLVMLLAVTAMSLLVKPSLGKTS